MSSEAIVQLGECDDTLGKSKALRTALAGKCFRAKFSESNPGYHNRPVIGACYFSEICLCKYT